jgi:hypothetical protein
MINPELRTLGKQRARRDLLKMSAIAVPVVVLTLAMTTGAVGKTHPAPAPSIGSGITAALGVGGVLLGMKFLKRLRRQS